MAIKTESLSVHFMGTEDWMGNWAQNSDLLTSCKVTASPSSLNRMIQILHGKPRKRFKIYIKHGDESLLQSAKGAAEGGGAEREGGGKMDRKREWWRRGGSEWWQQKTHTVSHTNSNKNSMLKTSTAGVYCSLVAIRRTVRPSSASCIVYHIEIVSSAERRTIRNLYLQNDAPLVGQ